MKLGAYDDTYILFFFFYQSSEAVNVRYGGQVSSMEFFGGGVWEADARGGGKYSEFVGPRYSITCL